MQQRLVEPQTTSNSVPVTYQGTTHHVLVNYNWSAQELKEAVATKFSISGDFKLILGGQDILTLKEDRPLSKIKSDITALKVLPSYNQALSSLTQTPVVESNTILNIPQQGNYIVVRFDARRDNLVSQAQEVELIVYKDIRDAETERARKDEKNKTIYEDGQKLPITGVSFLPNIDSEAFKPTNVDQWLKQNKKAAPAILETMSKGGGTTYYLVGNNQGRGEKTITVVRDSDKIILEEIKLLKSQINMSQKFTIDPQKHKALDQKLRTLYSPHRRETFSICSISLGKNIANEASCKKLQRNNQHGEILEYTVKYTGGDELPSLNFTKLDLIEYNGQKASKRYVFDTKEAGDQFRNNKNNNAPLLTKPTTDDRITFEFNSETETCEFRVYGDHARQLVDVHAKDIFSLDVVSYGKISEIDSKEVGFCCVIPIDLAKITWPTAFISALKNKLVESLVAIQPGDGNKGGYDCFRIDLKNEDDSLVLAVICGLQEVYSQYKQELTPVRPAISQAAYDLAAKSWEDISIQQHPNFKLTFSQKTRSIRGERGSGAYWDSLSADERAKFAQSIISEQVQQTSPIPKASSSEVALKNLRTTINYTGNIPTTSQTSSSILMPGMLTSPPALHRPTHTLYQLNRSTSASRVEQLKECLITQLLDAANFSGRSLEGQTAISNVLDRVLDANNMKDFKVVVNVVREQHIDKLTPELQGSLLGFLR